MSIDLVCSGSATYACPADNITVRNISYFREECEPSEGNSIPTGVILGCLGSIGINLGNNLQALGLNVQARELTEHIEKLEREGYDIDAADAELPKVSKVSRGNVIFGIGWSIFLTSSIINFVAACIHKW